MANKGEFFTGSLCLSDIDKSLIKKADNGKMYLNISVGERTNKETGEPEPDKYGATHYVSCQPPKEQREEGKNYFIGNLKRYVPKPAPTPADIEAAPAITQEEADDLPF